MRSAGAAGGGVIVVRAGRIRGGAHAQRPREGYPSAAGRNGGMDRAGRRPGRCRTEMATGKERGYAQTPNSPARNAPGARTVIPGSSSSIRSRLLGIGVGESRPLPGSGKSAGSTSPAPQGTRGVLLSQYSAKMAEVVFKRSTHRLP